MATLDYSLFSILYHLSGLSHFGDLLIIFFGEYFFYIILFVLAALMYRGYRQKNILQLKQYALAIFSALIARFGIASIIRFFYHRPRPFLDLSLPHLINDTTYSFPSGHTIFMFALATSIYFFNKKLAYFLYASGLVIGLARVAGGVHYLSDIVSGVVLGALIGWAVYKLFEKYQSQNI